MLNAHQQRAVDHDSGHLLIVAGPGTGKTHTLTRRIQRVLKKNNPAGGVLAITFTRKAAGEMTQRLKKLVAEQDLRRCFVGTFHQWGVMVLKTTQSVRLLTENEADGLAARLWPDKRAAQRKAILHQIAYWKGVHFDEDPPRTVRDYNAALSEEGLMDFDDVILRVIERLRLDEALRRRYQQRFPYIFVDEYQDINRAQRVLLKTLIGPQSTLTAIGDPCQAIYGFRGGDLTHFEAFARDFPNATVLALADNYRCATHILQASQQVMAPQASPVAYEIVARVCEQGRLILKTTSNDKSEAAYVAREIERLIGGWHLLGGQRVDEVPDMPSSPMGFGDIAVLYRLNAQRFVLQKALEQLGIPYQVLGVRPDRKAGSTPEEDLYDACEDSTSWEAEKVALMSLHAAKGLEFSCVFIVGCEDGILPLRLDGRSCDLDEERRLFYVGMTRAKQRLYLVRAGKRVLYGRCQQNQASPFLRDIEESLKTYAPKSRLKPVRKKEHQMTLF